MSPLRTLLPILLLAALLPASLSAQSGIEGDWILVLDSPQGVSEIPITVSQDGTSLAAGLSVDVPEGEDGFDMTGTLNGENVTWNTEVDFQGMPLEINLMGDFDGDTMSGTADYGGMAQGTWEAERDSG